MKQILFSLSDFLKIDTVEKKVDKVECNIDNDLNISVSLKAVKISDESIYVSGTIEGDIYIECSRCLFIYPHHIKIEISSDMDFHNGIVDMSEEIRQLIILEMPMKPICSDECLGICRVCGRHNKVNDTCSCKIEEDFIKERWESLLNKNNRRK